MLPVTLSWESSLRITFPWRKSRCPRPCVLPGGSLHLMSGQGRTILRDWSTVKDHPSAPDERDWGLHRGYSTAQPLPLLSLAPFTPPVVFMLNISPTSFLHPNLHFRICLISGPKQPILQHSYFVHFSIAVQQITTNINSLKQDKLIISCMMFFFMIRV